MRHATWGSILAVLALAACGGNADDQTMAADSTAMNDSMAMAPAAPADTAMAGMAGQPTQVNLTALENSGVTGQATLSAEGGGTSVMVTLNAGQGQGGTVHQGHIHTGTCAEPAGVEQPLQPITLDASGTGTMTTTVSIAPDSLMDGNHVIMYHEAGGSPGKPVTCGAIPQHTM